MRCPPTRSPVQLMLARLSDRCLPDRRSPACQRSPTQSACPLHPPTRCLPAHPRPHLTSARPILAHPTSIHLPAHPMLVRCLPACLSPALPDTRPPIHCPLKARQSGPTSATPTRPKLTRLCFISAPSTFAHPLSNSFRLTFGFLGF